MALTQLGVACGPLRSSTAPSTKEGGSGFFCPQATTASGTNVKQTKRRMLVLPFETAELQTTSKREILSELLLQLEHEGAAEHRQVVPPIAGLGVLQIEQIPCRDRQTRL